MLATTALIALGRKIADDRAKKKEAKVGPLLIGDSNIARNAFASQTKTIQDGHLQRSGTDIKWDNASEISPDSALDMDSPKPESQDARTAPLAEVGSPLMSEKALVSATQTPSSQHPPPYSPGTTSRKSDTYSPSTYSRDASALSPSDTKSTSDTASLRSSSTFSPTTSMSNNTSTAVRVKTNGTDLKSGFPYHPALFDLKVRPDEWDRFCSQVIQTTKFGAGDHAQMWAAATATALTGAIATSVWVGRTMNRTLQEKKVKAGLQDMKDGGLGDTLQQWNESYFKQHGLFVHLELSESALKGKTARKHYLLHGSREERDRKREERKFVIVVTKLDEDGAPAQALNENGVAVEMPAEQPAIEMPVPEDAKYHVAEMPGDEGQRPIELPAELPAGVSLGYGADFKPTGYVELPADTTAILEKTHLDDKRGPTEDPFADRHAAQDLADSVPPLNVSGFADSQETIRAKPLRTVADVH